METRKTRRKGQNRAPAARRHITPVIFLVLAMASLTIAAGEAFAAVIQIAAGNSHTVALMDDGTVSTWGRNTYNQLGDGTATSRATPMPVPGLNGVTAIAAGWGHTVALLNDGTVRAWGYNSSGQLGDTTTTNRPTPVTVPGLAGVTAIAAGDLHTVALLNDGTVMAWGAEWTGTSYLIRATPITVAGLTGVAAIAAGDSHTVALLNGGTVRAWGSNTSGQLGDTTTTGSTTPVAIPDLTGVTAIAAGGKHTATLLSDGTVKTWGANGSGQLGDTPTISRPFPLPVPGLTGVTAIAAGGNHTMALLSDGTVRAWGGNGSGQLGDTTTTGSTMPVPVTGLTGVTAIAAGGSHTVAILNAGTVTAWGNNYYGQLGSGQLGVGGATIRTMPAPVTGLTGVAAIATGTSHTVALLNGGTASAWGDNYWGQLGNDTTTASARPVPVTGLTDAKALAAGTSFTVALLNNGTLRTWGYNHFGQLGTASCKYMTILNGQRGYCPTPVDPGLTGVTAVASGSVHTVALMHDGTVKTWGYVSSSTVTPDPTCSYYYEYDEGAPLFKFTYCPTPYQVPSLTGVSAVAAGLYHGVALLNDGTVTSWKLGAAPVAIPGLVGVKAIAAGYDFTVALLHDGTVRAWGANSSGQLGDGTTTDRPEPVAVPGLTEVNAIAAGWDHTVALLNDGTVRTWGSNSSGQLGDGTTTNRPTPVFVPGLTGVKSIEAGVDSSRAILNDGTVRAWGGNFPIYASYFPAPVIVDALLTVTKEGNGRGSVMPSPGALSWVENTGIAFYPFGSAVTLTATPDSCSSFAGWTGGCAGTGPCTLVMDGNQSLTATFTLLPGAVTVAYYRDADGDGYGNPAGSIRQCLGDPPPPGYVTDNTDCNDANPAIHPGAVVICADGADNNCNGVSDAADPSCTPPPAGPACSYDAQCREGEYCKRTAGDCIGVGYCTALLPEATACMTAPEPVCGCDGKSYAGACAADKAGVNVAATGQCASSGYRWKHSFPAIMDNSGIGWENYLTVQAKDAVPMEVTIRVYNMDGMLMGTYIYSDTDPAAQAPAIAPYARVAARPSMIVGTQASPIPVEGSMIVETSVPAIATTNTISNFFEGFSIVEATKPRSIHSFPKAFDGPNNYQVSMLVQNIHATARNVTATLYGKNATSPGHGAKKTYTIPAYGTLKFRPSDVAGGIDFNGSVVVSSDGAAPGDGLGPAIPAMCRYELGKEAMTIYESTVEQPSLYFPTVKDGKFGGAGEFQNFLSVVNPGATDATVEVILYNNDGAKKATTGPVVMQAGGKGTWRPSMILGTISYPIDFSGSVLVTSTVPVVGQTNTMYPGNNMYQCDAFDLFESAIPNSTLFFPKAFDNIVADGHLYDNFVYVQNPDTAAKNILIQQFNNNGMENGVQSVPLGPNATYVYRPKYILTDTTGQFRGSIRVTEKGGGKITGAIKYDIHQGSTSTTSVDAMTLYRSMGQ